MAVDKYDGTISWDGGPVKAERVILANDQRLSIGPMRYEGRAYYASLEKTAAGLFRGEWTCDRRRGTAWCIFTKKDENATLSGRWFEDGREYSWAGRFDRIDEDG